MCDIVGLMHYYRLASKLLLSVEGYLTCVDNLYGRIFFNELISDDKQAEYVVPLPFKTNRPTVPRSSPVTHIPL